MNLKLLFELPSEASTIIETAKSLTDGTLIVNIENDPQISNDLSTVRSEILQVESDIASFRGTDFLTWFNSLKKFANDITSISSTLLTICATSGTLVTDPAVHQAMSQVLIAVKDVSEILSLFGVKLALPVDFVLNTIPTVTVAKPVPVPSLPSVMPAPVLDAVPDTSMLTPSTAPEWQAVDKIAAEGQGDVPGGLNDEAG